MEGYLHFKIRPFLRRLVTRLLAIVPTVLTVLFMGAAGKLQIVDFEPGNLEFAALFCNDPADSFHQ